MVLEWQIVSATLRSRFRCWREWCSIRLSLNRWEGRSSGISHWGYLTANHVVSTDIIKPTAIILAGIDIELDRDILTILNIELFDAVFTKDIEDTTSGILARNFNHILLRHPWVATTG